MRLESSRLNLEIIAVPGLRNCYEANGLAGRFNETIGLIIDSGLNAERTMVSVAHEMIHVKQLARGTLKYRMRGNKEIAIWCGKHVTLPYYERPWEIEAYGRQELLARRFADALEGVK